MSFTDGGGHYGVDGGDLPPVWWDEDACIRFRRELAPRSVQRGDV